MKLQDLLKDLELGKVYTDKDRKPFKVNEVKCECNCHQEKMTEAVNVPVATSSLMQVQMVQNLLPKNKKVGILTIHKPSLKEDHLKAANVPLDTPIIGTENGKEFSRVILNDEKEMDVDPVSNAYGFIANMRKPFNIITWLASKSVSEQGNAGYFFYQTQDGYQFKSIDNLINQEPKATYEYTEVNVSDTERNNDFNINWFIHVDAIKINM